MTAPSKSQKTSIRPMPGMVVIEPLKLDEKSKGGVVIPESARRPGGGRFDGGSYQPIRGKVIEVTPPVKGDTQLKKGDVVLYHAGNENEWNDKTIHVVSEGDVVAVVDGE